MAGGGKGRTGRVGQEVGRLDRARQEARQGEQEAGQGRAGMAGVK
jgi:hypothetical protein